MFTFTMWISFVIGFFFTALCLRFADHRVKREGFEDETES